MCEVVYQSFVKPKLDIVSYLTPLTGITYVVFFNFHVLERKILQMLLLLKIVWKKFARFFLMIVYYLVKALIMVIVSKCTSWLDIYWLRLKLGEDFANVIDLLYMFCYRNYPSLDNTPKSLKVRGGMTSFSLRQVVLCLIGVDIQVQC